MADFSGRELHLKKALAITVLSIWAAVQALATNSTRATAVALGFLIVTLIGLGFGPLLVGATSDLLNIAGASARLTPCARRWWSP